ncbi:8527_t:CDS:2 [Ambispora leptoticha]|uniref:8527_t:CDS:1 n=1 Tax=Ambispora leptoticha TaxID=144679 RepID=A0A9N9BQU4_9GLOM|nr:8527_t:CDS:2 [Ambispora leptoticha]
MESIKIPTSSSNNATEEKPAPTLAEVVRKLNTEKLIEFLRGEEDLQLNDAHFEILRKEEISGRNFLKLSKQDFRDCGFKVGPATTLADFAKEVKEKKLRAYSSFRTQADVKEVLEKYKLGDSISSIPQFQPTIHKLEDTNEALMHCIKELRLKLKNLGGLAPDSNEAVRCEFISPILHASVSLLEGLILAPQFETNSGAVNEKPLAKKRRVDRYIDGELGVKLIRYYEPGRMTIHFPVILLKTLALNILKDYPGTLANEDDIPKLDNNFVRLIYLTEDGTSSLAGELERGLGMISPLSSIQED